MRRWLAAVGFVAAGLSACTSPEQDEAVHAADRFVAAVTEADGEAACAVLAPTTVTELEQSAKKPCAEAVLEEATKALAEGRRTITLRFRKLASSWLSTLSPNDGDPGPNELVLELTDQPQISIDVRAKKPGPGMELADATMTMNLAEEVPDADPLEAYERLLLDVLRGDQTLFTRADEVDRLWQVCQPVLDAPPEVSTYGKGSWGPHEALELPEGGWRLGD